MVASRPVDECPFPRPLSLENTDCATFHPLRYLPLDLNHRPLRPVVSCRHMQLGVDPNAPHRYYCRCALGDAAARLAAVAGLTETRLRLMRQVVDLLNDVIAVHAESLAQAKGRELAASGGSEREAARRIVRQAAAEFESDFSRQLQATLRDSLAELGVEPDAVLRIVHAGVEDYEENGLESWQVPDDLLAPLPPDVRRFVKASYSGSARSKGNRGSSPC
jgi:hypothetical protein